LAQCVHGREQRRNVFFNEQAGTEKGKVLYLDGEGKGGE